MTCSIVVVGIVIHCKLLLSIYDLKAKQMNVQCSLIWELMLYEFELGHHTVEARDEDEVDHSTVTRWFKKFCSGYKDLNNQCKSGGLKTMDSKAVLQAIKANQVNIRQTWHLTVQSSLSPS